MSMFDSLRDLDVNMDNVTDPYLYLIMCLARRKTSVDFLSLLPRETQNIIYSNLDTYSQYSLRTTSKQSNLPTTVTNLGDLIKYGSLESIKEYEKDYIIPYFAKYFCIEYHRLDILKYLSKDCSVTELQTLVKNAVDAFDQDIIEYLVSRGAKVSTSDIIGIFDTDDYEKTDYFLNYFAGVKVPDNYIVYAAIHGNIALIERLGIPNEYSGKEACKSAIRRGQFKVVEYLNTKLNFNNKDRVDYLREATSKNKLDIVKFFVNEGTVINTNDIILTAILKGHFEIAKYLIESRVVNLTDNCITKCFESEKLTNEQKLELVKLLVRSGCPIKERAIDDALFYGYMSIAEFLLQYKQPTLKNLNDYLLDIRLASEIDENDKITAVKYLVDNGVTPDEMSLSYSFDGSINIAKYLLNFGVIPTQHTLEYAIQNSPSENILEVVKLLLNYNIVPTELSVYYAAARGMFDIADYLLQSGAKFSWTDEVVNNYYSHSLEALPYLSKMEIPPLTILMKAIEYGNYSDIEFFFDNKIVSKVTKEMVELSKTRTMTTYLTSMK